MKPAHAMQRTLAFCILSSLSGAVFAALIVLGNFSMNLFAPLVFSSVIATMVSRSFFGIEPWYHVPPMEPPRLVHLPWFILLGLVVGVAGAGFLKLLNRAESVFKKLDAYSRSAPSLKAAVQFATLHAFSRLISTPVYQILGGMKISWKPTRLSA